MSRNATFEIRAEAQAYAEDYLAAQQDALVIRKTKRVLNSAPGPSPGEDMLLCSCCGNSEYLHQDVVEVFDRSEDAEICRQTTVASSETLIQNTRSRGNLRSRRDGLSIRFWCEECEARSVVDIAQRMATTFLAHDCIEPNNSGVRNE